LFISKLVVNLHITKNKLIKLYLKLQTLQLVRNDLATCCTLSFFAYFRMDNMPNFKLQLETKNEETESKLAFSTKSQWKKWPRWCKLWIVGPRWGKPTCCDLPTWFDVAEQSKLHGFWQPWTPLGCAHCKPASCTPRFKCRVSHEFIGIKWTCITMGIN
jgi:hypothetical protein